MEYVIIGGVLLLVGIAVVQYFRGGSKKSQNTPSDNDWGNGNDGEDKTDDPETDPVE